MYFETDQPGSSDNDSTDSEYDENRPTLITDGSLGIMVLIDLYEDFNKAIVLLDIDPGQHFKNVLHGFYQKHIIEDETGNDIINREIFNLQKSLFANIGTYEHAPLDDIVNLHMWYWLVRKFLIQCYSLLE